MFQRSPGCRLSSGSAPRVRAKGHGHQRPGPRSGHRQKERGRFADGAARLKRAATDAGLPCNEAMILPQRGAPAAFDWDAPMSDRSKTEVLCRPDNLVQDSMMQSPWRSKLGTAASFTRGPTNLDHTTLQCKRVACPLALAYAFDQSVTAPSTCTDSPLSPGSVDLRAVIGTRPRRVLHFHRAFVFSVRSARRERQSCCRAQILR